MTPADPASSPAVADRPGSGASDLVGEANRVLAAIAGDGAVLRDDQLAAMEALVTERRRALVVQRTGWGKSAVYFVATALLRARGAGPTVVISPLLSLMRNQIAAAERAGLVAVTINSSNVDDWDAAFDRLARGSVDLLLVSPERLANPAFRERIGHVLETTCGLLVVDEAHCISDWGHDFRPDYRRIRTLLHSLPVGTPVVATTATANARVVADVAAVLELDTDGPAVLVQRGALDREALELGVLSLPDQTHRLAWLDTHLAELPGSGIVYTLTVAAADDVASFLRSRGHVVQAYTGRSEPEARLAAEEALLDNQVKALVATSALGMGFDKGDLGFVVHLGAPPSPVAYYQHIGRAGRALAAGARARVLLLPGPEDPSIWAYFAAQAFPGADVVASILSSLDAAGGPLSTPALEPSVPLSRSRLEATLRVLDVEGAVRRVSGGWEATGDPWAYDAERHAALAAARAAESAAMLAYEVTDRCRMGFLLSHLDDPAAPERCGRCDNCTGDHPAAGVDEDSLAAAGSWLGKAGVAVEPHKLWPTGMDRLGVPCRGRIGADAPQVGRAVARFTDLGWGAAVRQAAGRTAEDGPVPDALVRAAVSVLGDWRRDWPERPAAVISVGSRRHPRLVASFAAAIADIGRLPDLGAIEHTGPSREGDRTNSARRLAALWSTFRLGAEAGAALGGELAGRPLLLIDDTVDSGWTLCVVAALLHQAGAGAVYPLVLGIEG